MSGVINPKSGFSYTAPTKYTDGTALAASNIAKYQIGLGQTPGQYTLIKDDVTLESGAGQTSPLSLFGTLAFGQWYAAVRTVSKDGKTSAWSAPVDFELQPLTPEPPTGFSVA